jgi:RNA polymerase sigma-70 factor, ECF subfamily
MRVWRNHAAETIEADTTATDAALVAAARVDRLAFGPLYERYRDDLLRYCFYCLGDWDDAADATQQVFANALAGLSRFVDRDDSFRPWLFRIAHNEVLARQQRRARRPQRPLLDAAEIVDGGPSPEDLAITADTHQQLRLLLAQLPLEQRSVCALRLAGLRDQEIAAILGKRAGAVRTAQSRAVVHLRELMGITQARTGGCHD